MDKRFLVGLKACDKAKSFRELNSLFATQVLPILHQLFRTPLTEALADHISPAASCPEAAAVRGALNSLTASDDVWLLMLQHSSTLLGSTKRSRDGDMDFTVAANAFVLFYGRGIPKSNEVNCRWKFLEDERRKFESSPEYVNSNSAERKKMLFESVLLFFSERAYRHYFSQFWSKYLRQGTPSSLHLHLLNRLSTDILPNLTNPLTVADYLVGSFASGGLIAVLALKGILLLMLDHGLEYPKFYEQLYSLLTPDAFSSRHRYELFELVDLCMKSLRVPSYITAAVIKRIARIALLAPAPALYFALPFIRQLLQRHPNCLALIHRTSKSLVDAEAEGADQSDTAKQRSLELATKLFDGIDPFVMSENDPFKSNAAQSTLWELMIIEKHFLPAVPLMVSAFASPAEDNAPVRFEKTYGRLFTAEATKEISAARLPTMAYEQPTLSTEDPTNIFIV